MRILLANKFAHVTGGADLHALNLATLLRRRGHRVVFLSTGSERNVEREGAFVQAPSTHASRDSLPLARQPGVAIRALWNPAAAAATRELLESFDPDVVHAHKLYTQLSVAPVVVAARAGVPVVQTLHDFELMSASALDASGGRLDRDETRGRYRALNSATFLPRRLVHVPRVATFVAVSRFVARAYAAAGIEAVVLPNFASVDRPAGPPAQFSARRGVAYVGKLRPEKGVEDVVALAERLPELSVTVAGSGMLEPVIRAAAARLPNLFSPGFLDRDGVRKVLAGARVTVLPSRWEEPGALSALEAMELGTPVVAYSVGGIAEYVGDSGAGRVIPPGVEALTAACLELHDDERAWTEASRAALAAIAGEHSPERYAERLEAVYAAAGASRGR